MLNVNRLDARLTGPAFTDRETRPLLFDLLETCASTAPSPRAPFATFAPLCAGPIRALHVPVRGGSVMRTPTRRKRARDLFAQAQSTPHAEEGLFYVLRAMELEAETDLPGSRNSQVQSDRLRSAARRSPANRSE
jgi:hypothetical protein